MRMETATNDKIQVSGLKRCGLMKPKPPGANYQSNPVLEGWYTACPGPSELLFMLESCCGVISPRACLPMDG